MSGKKSNDVNVLVIFVDIKGFTSWAEKVDNFSFIDAFSEDWYALLKKTFDSKCKIKFLGDGAMIVEEIQGETTGKKLTDLLGKTVGKINKTDKSFADLCKSYSVKKGSNMPLSLGWGVTKGTVKKLNSNEYIGAEINKSARYCSIARPYGIVIDAVDFQSLPKNLQADFFRQKRILQGIEGRLDVWVSKEIFTQFLTRETLRQTPEVHIAGACFKTEKGVDYVLLGKRKPERKLFPNLYEGCGGQLAGGELFIDGVKRHYQLEYGIDVNVIEEEHIFYYIEQPEEPLIQGVRFLCEYEKGEPKSENHEPLTPQWYSKEDFEQIPEKDFIPGLQKEIRDFFERFSKRKAKEAKA
ncbi:MAG: hypothetical protein FWG66_01685 [Spirochaetes bacterium]|nr:hypothetical protein [Spirochaetota bacterium]